MIKKEYKLIPILGSKKELIPHHLIQKRDTHQFGTLDPERCRGRQARKYIRDNFDPVSLYVVDLSEPLGDHELGILTLKDNTKTLGKPDDFPEDVVASKEKVVIFQKDLFDCIVSFVGVDRTAHVRFRFITSKTLQSILEKGGRIWLEMEYQSETAELLSERMRMGFLAPSKLKFYEGKPIIHLTF